MKHRKLRAACAVLLLFCMAPALLARGYSDVSEGHWFYGDVTELSAMGIIDGDPDGRYRPSDELTVGQFLKLCAMAAFPDSVIEPAGDRIWLPDGRSIMDINWATKYFVAARELGIVVIGEINNTSTDLTRAITRYEAARILTRAARLLSPGDVPIDVNLERYITDFVAIPDPLREPVLEAYSRGLLQGDERHRFRGDARLTRAEAAAVILRLIDPARRLRTDFTRRLPVEGEWFSDAVFIGDSLTQGFMLMSGLKTTSYLCYQSVSTANFHSFYCINGMTQTIPGALKGTNYQKVFLMLGTNEMSTDAATFRQRYERVLDSIAELLPNATIYIQSIPPVSAALSERGSYLNRNNVAALNACLEEIAAARKMYFIDVYSALANENGDLPEDGVGWDGAHLSAAYYVRWYEYLRDAVANIKK